MPVTLLNVSLVISDAVFVTKKILECISSPSLKKLLNLISCLIIKRSFRELAEFFNRIHD